jgi:hypothetical protein
LVSATEEPFRFLFASWVGDTFGLNTIDQSEPTHNDLRELARRCSNIRLDL